MPEAIAIKPLPAPRLVSLNKDYYGGALMLLIGVGAAYRGRSYGVGTLSHMGSGFFPVTLGVVLALIGAAMLVGASRQRTAGHASARVADWRGWLCICAGTVAFIVLGRYGGLVPATFATVLLSALGDRSNSLRVALLLSTAMVAIGIIVFWWALQLQMPLFRWG
ncbi:tripartite tricarboxylate transporter TctB family protein [Paraburkholderia sp. C35]|uniref:tripartite tricarboxylate transporter TctB family protein n=1 Tax=Paraburkholderia sp. C35 TaxID=2126993 RepID=UPI000D68C9EB|nr:tripartite tricarboxylate transporter TctB family protein [Paraburkholderia sp. C35]